MWHRWKTSLMCAIGMSVGVQAGNEIHVWQASGSYTLSQPNRTVEITSPGAFKIGATCDDCDWGGLGEIAAVSVGSVQGAVELHIVTDPNDPYGQGYDPNDPDTHWGAAYVGMVGFASFPPAGTTLQIAELRVYKDLGYSATAATRVSTVTGPFIAAEHVLKDVYIYDAVASGGSLVFGFMTGGSVFLPNASASHAGTISVSTIERNLMGTPYELNIAGSAQGDTQVGHEDCTGCKLTGKLHVGGSANNILVYTTSYTMTGKVEIGELHGLLVFDNDVYGAGTAPAINIGTLTGEVRLWRSLDNNPNASAEVVIDEMASARHLRSTGTVTMLTIRGPAARRCWSARPSIRATTRRTEMIQTRCTA